MTLKPVNE